MTASKQEIESIAIYFESSGMTPMEARVFTLLLLADPPEMDFFAIREFLQASKSAVSNALKRLMGSGRVDYMTKPGDRKRYFKVNPELWLDQMKQEIASLTPMLSIVDRIVQDRQKMETPEFNDQLQRVKRFYEFMVGELPSLLRRWEETDGKP